MLQVIVATNGPDETQEIGRRLAPGLRHGDVLILRGDLGAGKTCLTQGIGRGLGIEARITSPTFALANQYRATRSSGAGAADESLVLHHLDVYRLDSAAESLDLDLPELQDSGITVVEWGERIMEALGPDYLSISLRYADLADGVLADGADTDAGSFVEDNRRILTVSAHGKGWEQRFSALTRGLEPWLVEGMTR